MKRSRYGTRPPASITVPSSFNSSKSASSMSSGARAQAIRKRSALSGCRTVTCPNASRMPSLARIRLAITSSRRAVARSINVVLTLRRRFWSCPRQRTPMKPGAPSTCSAITPLVPPARAANRNVAVIAHVEHGKTSLVNSMLGQAGLVHVKFGEGGFTLDSMTGNPLEREKGVTILSKIIGIPYRDQRTEDNECVRLNIIDTPGHADFGGEVERVLGMADGALLIVDAAEGPMPQTRFVLQKAFELGLRPIVVINKVDRKDARADWVLEATSDLFLDLATDAAQLEFPVLNAVAREGRAGLSADNLASDLRPLFDTILDHVPPPTGDSSGPLQVQVTTLDYDSHQGRFAIGRIRRGTVRPSDSIVRINRSGEKTGPFKIIAVYTYEGLARVAVDCAAVGDIVALTGVADVAISDTLADPQAPEALPAQAIEEPTVRMTFGVNTSPFAGRQAKLSSTSRP